MAAMGVPTVDLHAATRRLGPLPELLCDHVHFHPWVREAQGEVLARWLVARHGGGSGPGPWPGAWAVETERLVLGGWHSLPPAVWDGGGEHALPDLVAAMLTPAVTAALPPDWHGGYTRERAAQWIVDRDAEATVLLAADRAGPTAVGLVILAHAGRELRLGYLLREAAWGQGLGSELVRAVAGRARALGATVVAGVATDNTASVRVLEKAGFVREGEARGEYLSRLAHGAP